MHEFEIKLGGQSFTVKPLPIRPARELRQKIGTALDGPLNAIKAIQRTEITDTDALAEIAGVFKDVLLGYVDIALDLVIGYAKLEAERDWIEDNAIDDEVITAFVEVAKRLFPFEALKPLITSLMAGGSKIPPISKS